MVSLLPDADQEQLVDAITAYLDSELPVARLHDDDPLGVENAKWQEMAALGWFGLGLSEEDGGAGFGLAESVLAFRAFGRHLLRPAVLGTTLAARLAVESGDRALAARFVSGEARAGLAEPCHGARIGASCAGDFWLIDAEDGEWVVAWGDAGAVLLAIDGFAASDPQGAIDWTLPMRRTSVLASAEVWAPADRLGVAREATLLTAALLGGNAEATRDMAVAYAKVREQFGQPIGAFQAVKHHCANMAVLTEAAWTQTAYATLVEAGGQDGARFEGHAARVLAADAAIRNGETNIQVHGGIGFTADADPHLFLKRAHLLNRLGGELRHHQRRLLEQPLPMPGEAA